MIQYFMSPLTSLLRQRIAGRQNTRQIYRGNDLVILVRGLGSTTPPQETRIIDKTKVSSFVSASLLYRTGERQFMAEDLLVIVGAFFLPSLAKIYHGSRASHSFLQHWFQT